ncbi:MAG: hypothetical protein L6R39_006654 [Caloplaca ligustica]|nr:MAG: hypothetical protein L6R39_006654 [Caloplaca ligustica]
MNGSAGGGFRPATPNSKGQYSDAVLSELENQNDAHVEGISAKVKMLKDITIAIGDEIRDSSKLTDTMNDSFDNTRVRLRGTMNRMPGGEMKKKNPLAEELDAEQPWEDEEKVNPEKGPIAQGKTAMGSNQD